MDKADSHTHTHTHTYSLDIPIFAKTYEFYKVLTNQVISFPKTKRYTLGQRLDDIALDIFELLSSIPTTNDKVSTLNQISIKLDLLKILVRLAKDSLALNDKVYLELQEILQEIGRMLGGWIKASKQNTTGPL